MSDGVRGDNHSTAAAARSPQCAQRHRHDGRGDGAGPRRCAQRPRSRTVRGRRPAAVVPHRLYGVPVRGKHRRAVLPPDAVRRLLLHLQHTRARTGGRLLHRLALLDRLCAARPGTVLRIRRLRARLRAADVPQGGFLGRFQPHRHGGRLRPVGAQHQSLGQHRPHPARPGGRGLPHPGGGRRHEGRAREHRCGVPADVGSQRVHRRRPRGGLRHPFLHRLRRGCHARRGDAQPPAQRPTGGRRRARLRRGLLRLRDVRPSRPVTASTTRRSLRRSSRTRTPS